MTFFNPLHLIRLTNYIKNYFYLNRIIDYIKIISDLSPRVGLRLILISHSLVMIKKINR